MAPFILPRTNLRPLYWRDDDHDFKSNAPDHETTVKVLVLVSVFGWLLFGVICILCINGRGRAGRWIPEWYLDSKGTRTDKAMVALWWALVMVLWPVILPVFLGNKIGTSVVKKWEKMKERRAKSREQTKAESGSG